MDAASLDPTELSHSLDQVSAVNRWLGGSRTLRRHIAPLLGRRGGSLLDVGMGNGSVLRGLLEWARRADGVRWEGIGVDVHPDVLAAAVRRRRQKDPVRILRADAARLPFADDCVDVAFCTLTLHHFDDGAAVRVLEEMARVARRRVIVSDLLRSRAHYIGARLLAATLWRKNRLTRHDGPLSVLRSFTPDELVQLGRAAGLDRIVVHSHIPFRVVLVADVDAPDDERRVT